jgi:hypothetical protein
LLGPGKRKTSNDSSLPILARCAPVAVVVELNELAPVGGRAAGG